MFLNATRGANPGPGCIGKDKLIPSSCAVLFCKSPHGCSILLQKQITMSKRRNFPVQYNSTTQGKNEPLPPGVFVFNQAHPFCMDLKKRRCTVSLQLGCCKELYNCVMHFALTKDCNFCANQITTLSTLQWKAQAEFQFSSPKSDTFISLDGTGFKKPFLLHTDCTSLS